MARYMTEQEQRFWEHALSNDQVAATYLRNQAMYGQDVQKQASNMMVSTCCESLALHHKGGIMCGKCGKWTVPTMRARDYVEQGMFR